MDAFASLTEQEPNSCNTKWKMFGRKKSLNINHGLTEGRGEGDLFKAPYIYLAVESVNGVKVEVEIEFDDAMRNFKMQKVRREADHPAEKAYANPGVMEKFYKN
jgi:hypothetical protein